MRSTKRSCLKQVCGAVVALGLMSEITHAEVHLDDKFPWTEAQVGYALHGVHYFVEALNRDQVARGIERESYGTLNFFHMLWNDRTFYVAGVQYTSKEQTAEVHRATLAGEPDAKTLAGGGVCTLFIYDEQLKQVAKHDVKLNEADGHTWCNDARALARVKGQDALLFSISYYLTDKPLAKKAKDIGGGWRYMTVLLKLREQDGKVVIEQDDSCLGNPNNLNDLRSARKVLTVCQ